MKIIQCQPEQNTRLDTVKTQSGSHQYGTGINIYRFFILSNKNAQIHKNRTQSMLFNCLFLTLYGCYGIRLY